MADNFDFTNEGHVVDGLSPNQSRRYGFTSADGKPRFWDFSLLRHNNASIFVRAGHAGALLSERAASGGFYYWNNNEINAPPGGQAWDFTSFLPLRHLQRNTETPLGVPLSYQYWRQSFFVQRMRVLASAIEVIVQSDRLGPPDPSGNDVHFFGLFSNGYASSYNEGPFPLGTDAPCNFDFSVSSSDSIGDPYYLATSKNQISCGPGKMIEDWNDLVLLFRLPIYANKFFRARGIKLNTAPDNQGGDATALDVNFFGHPEVNTWLEFSSDIFPRVIADSFGGNGGLLSEGQLGNYNFSDGRGKIHFSSNAGSYNGLVSFLGFAGRKKYGSAILFSPFEQKQLYDFGGVSFSQVFLPGDILNFEIDVCDDRGV